MNTRPALVLVGDGLTANGQWHEWLTDCAVTNLAQPGETSARARERITEICEHEPDIVSILVGTNDLAWHVPVEHTVRAIEMLVHGLVHAPIKRVIVHSIPPRERKHSDHIRQINRHIRQFSMNIRAEYLDLWPYVATLDQLDPGLSDDGVGFNRAGYDLWRSVLAKALVSSVPEDQLVHHTPVPQSLRSRRGLWSRSIMF